MLTSDEILADIRELFESYLENDGSVNKCLPSVSNVCMSLIVVLLTNVSYM